MVPTRLYETAVTRDQNPMHFGGKKTVVAIGKQRSLPIDIIEIQTQPSFGHSFRRLSRGYGGEL